MTRPEKRDARTYVLALAGLSTIAFLAVDQPFFALLKHMSGTTPQSIRAIPGLAYCGALGISIGQRKPVDRGLFFRLLGLQGIAATAAFGLAVWVKAMGGF
jgi:hypothetical protein